MCLEGVRGSCPLSTQEEVKFRCGQGRVQALLDHIQTSEALFGANRGSKFLALDTAFDF